MKKIVLVFIVFFLFNISTYSQCSMCRAVAKSSQQGGSSIANGLNSGILYLMSFPYILLFFGLIYLYYRQQTSN